MKKTRFAAWVLVGFIGLLFILFWAIPARDFSETEKRYLAEAPTLTWEALVEGTVSQEVEDYLADHFPGRNLFVGLNAYWNLITGRNAAGSIYYCDDGYLLRAPEATDLSILETNISRFSDFAASAGLPSTLIAVPDAGYILDDLLPANHDTYPDEEALAAIDRLSGESLEVLDLTAVFESARETTQLYYKTDHHLTSAGCYTVYDAFCTAGGYAPRAKSEYTILASSGFRGTGWSSSGYWLNKADTVEVWDHGDDLTVTITEAGSEDVVTDSPFFLDNLLEADQYTAFLDGNHTLVTIENHSVHNGKRLLVLRDSFGHCLAPFLASDYEAIVLVDLRYYRLPVSQLISDWNITELAFVYGMESLLTDTNSAWLY